MYLFHLTGAVNYPVQCGGTMARRIMPRPLLTVAGHRHVSKAKPAGNSAEPICMLHVDKQGDTATRRLGVLGDAWSLGLGNPISAPKRDATAPTRRA